MSTIALPTSERMRLGVTPASNGMLMSLDEFDEGAEFAEGNVYELIQGVLVVNPPPLEAEREPNDELGYLLRRYRESHPEGKIINSTLPEQTVCTKTNRRRADRIIWSGLGRTPNPLYDPPTVVIEFVSEGTRNRQRDYVAKRAEYLDVGVKEYWIFDRFRRTLTVCRPDEPDFIIHEHEIYRPALLPGFELPLSRVLAAADLWKK